MSYTITISGKVTETDPTAAETAETAIATTLRTAVATLDGVTSASGSFDYIGSQSLMPPLTVDAALAALETDAAALPSSEPGVQDVLDALAALKAAIEASENQTENDVASPADAAIALPEPTQGLHVADPSAALPREEPVEATHAATAPVAL